MPDLAAWTTRLQKLLLQQLRAGLIMILEDWHRNFVRKKIFVAGISHVFL